MATKVKRIFEAGNLVGRFEERAFGQPAPASSAGTLDLSLLLAKFALGGFHQSGAMNAEPVRTYVTTHVEPSNVTGRSTRQPGAARCKWPLSRFSTVSSRLATSIVCRYALTTNWLSCAAGPTMRNTAKLSDRVRCHSREFVLATRRQSQTVRQ